MIIEPISPVSTPTLIDALSRWALASGAPWDAVAGTAAGVVCLDSSLVTDTLGRWTLAAAMPVATLACTAGQDPFGAVGRLLARGREVAPTDLPFCGGAIGIWGYDCAEASGATHPVRDGDKLRAWWGFYDTFVAIDHHTQRAWVASWGLARPDAEPDSGLARARIAAILAELPAPVSTDRCVPQTAPRVAPAITQAQHGQMIDAILEDIAEGEFYQACATYPMTGPRGGTALELFHTLRERTPAPFAAYLAPGHGMSLAGASPERFLDLRRGRVHARPMKGTRPRGATAADDLRLRAELRESAKDRAENVMIVDLMRNDLGRVCTIGSVRVPALYTVETYATVHQLTSTITGQLRPDVPPWELARACFPPGSMTGAPKLRAMERLAQLEHAGRGWYSGVAGYIDVRGEMDLSVVIRTALVSEAGLRWHVGGGIVADSTPEAEWRESLDKCPAWLRE